MPGLQGIDSRAVIGMFFEELELASGMSWVELVSILFDSDQESETYKWLGATPMLREWINGRLAKGLRVDGVTIENKEFEATLEVARKDMRRDKTKQLRFRIAQLASRTIAHWAKLLTALLAAGETADCYDGKKFFAANHSTGDSGTLKNLLTATEVATLNVSTAAAPTADEMASAILGIIAYMMTYKDDQGEPMHENATEWHVQCPAGAIYASALQAVTKNMLATGSGTRDNPLKNSGFKVTVSANARLTWTTDFCVFRADATAAPFIRQEEVPVEMDAIAEGSEHEFKNNEHLYGVYASRNVGYGYFQHASKSTLS